MWQIGEEYGCRVPSKDRIVTMFRVICLESQDDVAENGEALDEQDSEEEQDDDNKGEG